jgi:hypothetical protein
MKTVDRVMQAYKRKHKLTEDQAKVIRAELSKFIDDLLERNCSSLRRNEINVRTAPGHRLIRGAPSKGHHFPAVSSVALVSLSI